MQSALLQTEKNLYLLVTFHNLSAPFTVDCEGAYIEVMYLRIFLAAVFLILIQY